MKKIFALFLALFFIFALCACKKTEGEYAPEHTHDHTHIEDTLPDVSAPDEDNTTGVLQSAPSQIEEPTNVTDISEKVDTEGHYKQKHITKIDNPCADELSKAQSDAVKKTIYDKYAEEWAKVSNRYYNELLKVKGSVPATANYNTDEQMHEYLEFYKRDFESKFDQQTKVFTNQMIEGADNTGVELMLSQLTYESNRELALYFIGVYEDIEEFSNQGY